MSAAALDRIAIGGSCGAVVWTSSMVLVEWLGGESGRLREFVSGASILELGGGLGFLGVSLFKMGASRVVVTDLPKQQRLIRKNIEANLEGSPGADSGSVQRQQVQCCSFIWGPRVPSQLRGHWDLVVGCDIVYDLDRVAELAGTLVALLLRAEGGRRGPTRVLLALPDRSDFGYRRRDRASGEWSPTLPDYEVLLADLERRLPDRLDVVLLDVIPPRSAEDYHADCGTNVHVLLITCAAKHR
jgi:predicted nicotinamide N-methyase